MPKSSAADLLRCDNSVRPYVTPEWKAKWREQVHVRVCVAHDIASCRALAWGLSGIAIWKRQLGCTRICGERPVCLMSICRRRTSEAIAPSDSFCRTDMRVVVVTSVSVPSGHKASVVQLQWSASAGRRIGVEARSKE